MAAFEHVSSSIENVSEEFKQNVIKYTIDYRDIIASYNSNVLQSVLQHINEGFTPRVDSDEWKLYNALIKFDSDNKSIVNAMYRRWGESHTPTMYKMLNISNRQYRNTNIASEYKNILMQERHEE